MTPASSSAVNAQAINLRKLSAPLSQVVNELAEALKRRSFRARIADAAAGLPDLDPVHRAAIVGDADA